MSGIRGRDTQPEMTLRRGLHRQGLRFRLHYKGLPGRPDIAFPSRKAVIFVHGCFWHRHPGCRYATTPKSNQDFWALKFSSNVVRDARTAEALTNAGWRMLVVWECELRPELELATLDKVTEWLRSQPT